jgi:hypothetical protein
MARLAGVGALVVAIVGLAAPARAQIDQQVRVFVGASFAGHSTFVDLTKDDAPSHAHFTIGAQAVWLGDIFGVGAEVADIPGFFEGGTSYLVTTSRVTTATGDVIVALPRRLAEYSLRLYFVSGGGIMRVREQSSPVFDIAKVVPAVDVGVGALGFLTNRVGLSWELRRFQRVGGPPPLTGITVAQEELSFWRAHMAVVIRYGRR